MANLNPCRCGNNPERVTTSSGLVRISCVLGKCADLVCLRPGVAERAWNEANPCDDAPTLRMNEVPTVAFVDVQREIDERLERMARDMPRRPWGHVARVRYIGPRAAELAITSEWREWKPPIGVGHVLMFCPDDGTRLEHQARLEVTLTSVDVPTETAYVKWDKAVHALPPSREFTEMHDWYVFAKEKP